MIRSFKNRGTEDVFDGADSKAARKICPSELWKVAYRKLSQLDTAVRLSDLAMPPGNKLEGLRKDRIGQVSIRINQQYRICFAWTTEGPRDVEIVDYH